MNADIKIDTDNPYYRVYCSWYFTNRVLEVWKMSRKWKKKKRIRPVFSYSRKIGSKTDSQSGEMARRINGIRESVSK